VSNPKAPDPEPMCLATREYFLRMGLTIESSKRLDSGVMLHYGQWHPGAAISSLRHNLGVRNLEFERVFFSVNKNADIPPAPVIPTGRIRHLSTIFAHALARVRTKIRQQLS
jgi:hypothetical protein